MERQHSNSSKPNMNNNNKECGIKAREFNEILVMTPEETKLENPNEKMYKISVERSPWVEKYLKHLKFPLITKEIDLKTVGKSISQDTCLTVANDGIAFSGSDISASNHQVNNINEKVSQFLDWNDSISKRKNEYDEILPDESLSRLPSGLDENKNYEQVVNLNNAIRYQLLHSHDSRDINDNIPWSNSNHVYWDEDVKYYRYPLESSLSTIDIRSDHSKIDDIPRIRSQPCLLDNYFTESNYSTSKKQKNTLDTFWKEIGEIENSFGYSSDSDTKDKFKKNVNDCPSYNNYNLNKLKNINEKQSNIKQEKNNLKWYKKDSSQNQFKNDHTLKTLNVEPHLNIENHSTLKCPICDCPDSVSKRQCIGDLRPSTENGKLAMSVNQITHRTISDRSIIPNHQIQKINNYLEKSKNDSQTLCEQCRNCCHCNKKKLENDKTENVLLAKRNKKLRELLGLKPEEKNVLVMLKL